MKTFFTERDIETMAAQGTSTLVLNDDTVYTELALEKARSLGMEFARQPVAANPPSPAANDVAAQVKRIIIAKLGDTVSEAVIDAAIAHALANFTR